MRIVSKTKQQINEICAAAQLWSPVTWSAKPVLANPSWEGNTWQGYNRVQSRPDHILLSVDLTVPPVTIDFRSSHTLRGTALASIDHALLRLTMQYRFRIRKQREKPRRLDRAWLAAATTDLHFAKHCIEEAEKWVQANSGKLRQLPQEAHSDPSWQYMESSVLNLALTAFPGRQGGGLG